MLLNDFFEKSTIFLIGDILFIYGHTSVTVYIVFEYTKKNPYDK